MTILKSKGELADDLQELREAYDRLAARYETLTHRYNDLAEREATRALWKLVFTQMARAKAQGTPVPLVSLKQISNILDLSKHKRSA